MSPLAGAKVSGEKPHFHGHRQRLRARLLEKGVENLSDLEVVEYLLYAGNPRGDVKPLAKALVDRFGSLASILSATSEELLAVRAGPQKLSSAGLAMLKVVPEAARRLARHEICDTPLVSSWQELLKYCNIAMAREPVEQFRILFLDRKNRLIADEVQQRGTIDHTAVYPREVIKRALELSASALILVHNHPSGDSTPSQADIEMTREIRGTAERLGIALHDHLVIARSGHSSFKTLGLL